jgi:phage terminase large subunit
LNSLADSSFAEVKAAIASESWLTAFFHVGETYIRTNCRRISLVFAGFRYNLDSIKSKAKILLLWVDEAEPVSANAWSSRCSPRMRVLSHPIHRRRFVLNWLV